MKINKLLNYYYLFSNKPKQLALLRILQLTSKRVIRELEHLIAWRGKPERIRVDNGPEFIADAMEQWAKNREIDMNFIQKGKPHQNGYVERFNRSYREEVLDAFCFNRLKEAQVLSNAWLWMYNNERPL